MGRWLEWRVTDNFTQVEVAELEALVDGPLRAALPLVAERLAEDRPNAPSFRGRLALWLNDRGTRRYAMRRDILTVGPHRIVVAPEWVSGREFVFLPCKTDRDAGHTVGFQDFATIGLLAAASQVSGKVGLVGGDDFDPDYVKHILYRFEREGIGLRPSADFTAG
jgi:hypothetical protein|nr:hypothetical protein [Neorhizobium tomejilense]